MPAGCTAGATMAASIFIDLRDRSGLLQLVFHGLDDAHDLRSEWAISARGRLVARDAENVNPNLATGEIELAVDELEVLASSPTPPFPLDEDVAVDEMLRLRYRSLDLRREPMRDAIVLRHAVVTAIRDMLNERDFLEIETPILTRATPGGRARLPRPGAHLARELLRAAAVAPAVQAAVDDRPATSATTRSRAASATRTRAPTDSPSSRSSTSRWRS